MSTKKVNYIFKTTISSLCSNIKAGRNNVFTKHDLFIVVFFWRWPPGIGSFELWRRHDASNCSGIKMRITIHDWIYAVFCTKQHNLFLRASLFLGKISANLSKIFIRCKLIPINPTNVWNCWDVLHCFAFNVLQMILR